MALPVPVSVLVQLRMPTEAHLGVGGDRVSECTVLTWGRVKGEAIRRFRDKRARQL